MNETTKTCDYCRGTFTAQRRRWWCEHCDKYFYICPVCASLDKSPCPTCGTRLKKKAEPMKTRR